MADGAGVGERLAMAMAMAIGGDGADEGLGSGVKSGGRGADAGEAAGALLGGFGDTVVAVVVVVVFVRGDCWTERERAEDWNAVGSRGVGWGCVGGEGGRAALGCWGDRLDRGDGGLVAVGVGWRRSEERE